MKKTTIAFLALLFCIQGVPPRLYAQHQGYIFGPHIQFEYVGTDTRFMVRQPATYDASSGDVDQVLDYFNPAVRKYGIDKDIVPKTPMMLGVKLNPDLMDYLGARVTSLSKSYMAYLISDSSEAELIALGITPSNAQDYLYHVVENDSAELVPWSPVTRMAQDHGAKKPYALIGKFRAPGKQIMIEVVNKRDYRIRDGVIFEWRVDYKPHIDQIIVVKANVYFNVNYAKLNGNYATRFDSDSGLPLDLRFPVDSVEWLSLNFTPHPTNIYSLYLAREIGGKKDTVLVENLFSEDTYLFGSKWFAQPGKYQLLIHRAADLETWKEPDILRLSFEVLSPPLAEKRVSIKQLLPYLAGAIAIIGLAFAGYYRWNKQKLRKAAQQKETVDLQLRSIRSQLNPHFMFNALAAIQGLMNKNDIAGANHYLSTFAGLTREVLDTSEDELISLEDELKILEDYLHMEQLRFGFSYEIGVDPTINRANTPMPSMLLQPFVENAVKHGVASLQQDGKIDISVRQHGQNLVLTVKDNGKGFDKARIDADGSGFGLKLTSRRMALLNEKYIPSQVSLVIDSDATGTRITVQLDQWTQP